MCAAVGCAGSADDVAPYSADKYGDCAPQTGSVAFDATDVTTGNLARCMDTADEWEFGATDCTHELKGWRADNGLCETIERRVCVRRNGLVDDRVQWAIDWRSDGSGTLSVAVYAGSRQDPYCRTDWTLKTR
jgi:hypothetical protein